MAYNRRYWRRYYRRYYRGKYSNSYYKTRMSRNFKASASNMTQGGTFNISVHFNDDVSVATGFGKKEIDIPNKISGSEMHRYLSNVFDQYRVEKLTIRIKPLGNTATNLSNPCILFTAMDRSGFASGISLQQIRTYGSYKETMVSGAKDVSPTHTCYIGQSNLVEWSTYVDSKNRPQFPKVIWGINYADNTTTTTSYVSIEIDAMVRYRGVRLDTSSVATSV